jgi:uncharacterized membrane protein
MTPFLGQAMVLGALSGMRSMAGLATLALRRKGVPTGMMVAMAAGEMVADKTPLVGDRIAPLPLAGRVLSGALVGGVVANDARGNVWAGALVGAAAAAVAAHLAFYARRRLPMTNLAGGFLEDAVVIGTSILAAQHAASTRTLPARLMR